MIRKLLTDTEKKRQVHILKILEDLGKRSKTWEQKGADDEIEYWKSGKKDEFEPKNISGKQEKKKEQRFGLRNKDKCIHRKS